MKNPSELSVLARWDHDLATIVLRGELDITSASRAERCLAGVLSRKPCRLVVDVAGLAFMDTQGVKLLARARRGLPAGRDVIIRDPNPSVHRMLALTGIDQVCIVEGQRLPPLPGAQSTA
ncbi:MAG: STAS domain-containing protein [Gemmatimonadota bacterium]